MSALPPKADIRQCRRHFRFSNNGNEQACPRLRSKPSSSLFWILRPRLFRISQIDKPINGGDHNRSADNISDCHGKQIAHKKIPPGQFRKIAFRDELKQVKVELRKAVGFAP
jgi:hypothetical protein